MNISLGRVLEAARERRATLTPEVAGYVILLAAQQLAVQRSRVSAHAVLLDEVGGVHIERSSPASELDIETVLRALLGDLIAVCPSPPPAIAAVAERDASGALRALIAELSAALIPINHSAARRALARLYREARRADGRAMDVAPAPNAEQPHPEPPQQPALPPEPVELDIDVVVEAASVSPQPLQQQEAVPSPAASLEPPPRDLLAPDLPTRDPGVRHGADDPIVSYLDRSLRDSPEELPLEPPPARPRWSEARSDVQELLAAYLVETRSVESMLGALRDMIGLSVRPDRDAPVDSASIAAVPR